MPYLFCDKFATKIDVDFHYVITYGKLLNVTVQQIPKFVANLQYLMTEFTVPYYGIYSTLLRNLRYLTMEFTVPYYGIKYVNLHVFIVE